MAARVVAGQVVEVAVVVLLGRTTKRTLLSTAVVVVDITGVVGIGAVQIESV